MAMQTVGSRLASTLSRNWWVLLVRGLVAIGFGFLCWRRPGISVAALVTLFGAFALVDGLLLVWAGLAGRKTADDWWVLLLGGIVGIWVGILSFSSPGVTALALLFFIAVWAIATGVLHITAAIRLRSEIEGEWLYILGGLASVVFGGLLMSQPGRGALAVLWLIGTYALFFGVVLVVLAFRARSFGKRIASA
jgi:uncharacterized membrane protein HdeD (DUF308 family)